MKQIKNAPIEETELNVETIATLNNAWNPNEFAEKCICAGASLRGRKSAPLCCIKLETATDFACGTGGFLVSALNALYEDAQKSNYARYALYCVVPLPPENEQKRLVEKIEELLPSDSVV